MNLIFSFFSGLLTGLSFNSPGLSFFAWVSLVPFIQALNKASNKSSLLYGLFFGLAYYGAAIFWIGNVSKLGLVFILTYLSFYYVLFALLARCLLTKPLGMVLFSCLWVIIEFLKENIWCGFGWANLGYSQYRNLWLIQITDLFGVKFITFLIAAVNFLIWDVLNRSFLKRKITRTVYINVIVIIGIFITCFYYAFYRADDLRSSGTIEVAVIQPNIPQALKWEESATAFIVDKLDGLSRKAKDISLAIFPEASWPITVDHSNLGQLSKFIKGIGKDALIGAVTKKNGNFYNSALLFDRQGNLVDTYDKVRLVPFGEYVPMRNFLNFIDVINSIGDMSRGEKITVFPYRDNKFSVLICFEDVFPAYTRYAAGNNDFLVNITNDAWFKGEPEASQHLGMMVLRAVENRISIIRSANTGISGWVSFKGEVEKLEENGKNIFKAGSQDFTVSLNKRRSFYNKYGEIFTFFCIFVLIGVLSAERAILKKKNIA